MRKRFEQQLEIGQLPIEDFRVSAKSKISLDDLLVALQAIYSNKDYNERIFSLLEEKLTIPKKNTGRRGLDLWSIFVLGQVRLNQNISYSNLHNLSNNHRGMRHVMGVERSVGYEIREFSYQRVYDNVTLLSDELIRQINEVVVEFGHREVFKKKRKYSIALKDR